MGLSGMFSLGSQPPKRRGPFDILKEALGKAKAPATTPQKPPGLRERLGISEEPFIDFKAAPPTKYKLAYRYAANFLPDSTHGLLGSALFISQVSPGRGLIPGQKEGVSPIEGGKNFGQFVVPEATTRQIINDLKTEEGRRKWESKVDAFRAERARLSREKQGTDALVKRTLGPQRGQQTTYDALGRPVFEPGKDVTGQRTGEVRAGGEVVSRADLEAAGGKIPGSTGFQGTDPKVFLPDIIGYVGEVATSKNPGQAIERIKQGPGGRIVGIEQLAREARPKDPNRSAEQKRFEQSIPGQIDEAIFDLAAIGGYLFEKSKVPGNPGLKNVLGNLASEVVLWPLRGANEVLMLTSEDERVTGNYRFWAAADLAGAGTIGTLAEKGGKAAKSLFAEAKSEALRRVAVLRKPEIVEEIAKQAGVTVEEAAEASAKAADALEEGINNLKPFNREEYLRSLQSQEGKIDTSGPGAIQFGNESELAEGVRRGKMALTAEQAQSVRAQAADALRRASQGETGPFPVRVPGSTYEANLTPAGLIEHYRATGKGYPIIRGEDGKLMELRPFNDGFTTHEVKESPLHSSRIITEGEGSPRMFEVEGRTFTTNRGKTLLTDDDALAVWAREAGFEGGDLPPTSLTALKAKAADIIDPKGKGQKLHTPSKSAVFETQAGPVMIDQGLVTYARKRGYRLGFIEKGQPVQLIDDSGTVRGLVMPRNDFEIDPKDLKPFREAGVGKIDPQPVTIATDELDPLRQITRIADDLSRSAGEVTPEQSAKAFADSRSARRVREFAAGRTPKGSPASKASLQASQVEESLTRVQRMAAQIAKVAKGEGTQIFRGMGIGEGRLGEFQYPSGRFPRGKIRTLSAGNDAEALSTLAHEAAHAIDFHTARSVGRFELGDIRRLFGVDGADLDKVQAQLLAVTKAIVGDAEYKRRAKYYKNPTETFARFIEAYMFSPSIVKNLAPDALAAWEKAAALDPITQKVLQIVNGAGIDFKYRPVFLPDLRQSMLKRLGTYLGGKAWEAEVLFRAKRARSLDQTADLIKQKMRGIEKESAAMFDAAEGILRTNADGSLEFGTRDYKRLPKRPNPYELKALEENGWEEVAEFADGSVMFQKWRWTPEEAAANFEKLSPQAQAVMREYVDDVFNAKSNFNRSMLAQTYGIRESIEGYITHFPHSDRNFWGAKRRRGLSKVTPTQMKHRTGSENYVRDFAASVYKQMTELEIAAEYNKFAASQLARVAEPLAEDASARRGWMVVQGDFLKRLVPEGSRTTRIITPEGESFLVKEQRYQIPKELYDRYVQPLQAAEEWSNMAEAINAIGRYYSKGLLIHPGTFSTNFIGGASQFALKIIQDAHLDLFNLNPTFPRTRADLAGLAAPLKPKFVDDALNKVTGRSPMPRTQANLRGLMEFLTPVGWQEAPDYLYGGRNSNLYEQLAGMGRRETKADKVLDAGLTAMGTIEQFFKKATLHAEAKKRGLQSPVELMDDPAVLAAVNDIIDTFAYDYDNVPGWLSAWRSSPFGSVVKPFATFGYKYAKMYEELMLGALDRSIPWRDRLAKIMTLGVAFTVAATWKHRRDAESEAKAQLKRLTPKERENLTSLQWQNMPSSFDLKVGETEAGDDIYLHTAKYPIFDMVGLVDGLLEGNPDTFHDFLGEKLGGLGPMGELALIAAGYGSKYDQHQPGQARVAETITPLIPGTRQLGDAANLLDPYRRSQAKTAGQVFGRLVPTTNPDLRERLAGSAREISVPLDDQYRGERQKMLHEREFQLELYRILFGTRLKKVNNQSLENDVRRRLDARTRVND